jgi:hypothetical protein
MLVFSNNVNGYKLYHSSNMGFSYEILDSSFANPSHTSALTSQAIFISFPGSSLASKRSFNHAQTWIDGPSYYNFIAQYDTVYGYKSGNNTYVYYSYDGGLTFDSTLASANIYSESAALKNGFITYDISNGNNFSYFNATTHATTNFTVNGFTGTAYFRAINFKNRVYLLTDDSTNIRIVYSNDGFQTVQTTNVLNTQPIFPEAVYVENGKMYVTYDGAYLVSTDGINFTEVLLSEPCIQTMVLNNGGTVIGRKYIYTSSIVVQDETFLYRKTFSDFCNPYFMVYPDTIQHHYFLVNMSSMDGTIVSHVWNWGDGSLEDTTMFPSHTYTQTGNYFISLTISDSAGFGCGMNQYTTINKENTAISIDVVAELPAYLLGLNPVENTSRLSISPNPCSGALSIHGSESAHVELWSITGEKVYDFGIRKNNDVIYFEELASGIYICKLINMQGDSKLLKVLKE